MMQTYINSFERYEKKYWITPAQQAFLLCVISRYVGSSEYTNYSICNIYYDTDNFDFIRASIEKPVYKEKLRLRSYGVPTENRPVYVELKKKYKGVVYKRRIETNATSANDLNLAISMNSENQQISKEIAWFLMKHQVKPKVYLAYDREAYAGTIDKEVRITFDTSLRFRETELDLRAGDFGEPLVRDNRVLMEIKTPGAMPIWLSNALSDVCAYPTSFSKYGHYYKTQVLTRFIEEVA